VKITSELIAYIATYHRQGQGDENEVDLPSLNQIGEELGIGISRLREQLEVAKALGFVEVKPRTGIRRLPYSFHPAVYQSLSFALAENWQSFYSYADLRNHIESSYWYEAVEQLTTKDKNQLSEIMAAAWDKLEGTPIHIPHREHRALHLLIYSRLNNIFVNGLLNAYWEAYESVGLSMYSDLEYLQQVWSYHQDIVDAIIGEDYEKGYQALILHRDLLYHRSGSNFINRNFSNLS